MTHESASGPGEAAVRAGASPGVPAFWWRREVAPGVTAAFTGRADGNLAFHVGDDPEAVRGHRERVARIAGVPGFHFMSQVHGVVAAWASTANGRAAPEADALLSRGEPLAVMVADCIPLILAGVFPDGRPALAAVHAGRPGLAAGVVPDAVGALRAAGAEALRAWIGPSVCGHCYEVPEEMRDDVERAVPGTGSLTRWGTPSLDLPAGAVSQLRSLGIEANQEASACTVEHEELFSHRRAPGEGRFAGLVWAHD